MVKSWATGSPVAAKVARRRATSSREVKGWPEEGSKNRGEEGPAGTALHAHKQAFTGHKGEPLAGAIMSLVGADPRNLVLVEPTLTRRAPPTWETSRR